MSLILSGTDGLSDVDGSAATPAIRGTDANTGIFFPAADTIAFAEGGAEVMRINSSGNVGIGTNSPGAKLDVRGSSTFLVDATNPTAWISVDSGLTTGSVYSQWNTTSSIGISGTYTNHPYTFVTNNTERMRIDSSGNVGIGTASMVTKLTVNGNATLYGTNPYITFSSAYNTTPAYIQNYTSTGELQFYTKGTGSDGYMTFWTGAGTERMRIGSSGNVGIGTSSPALTLSLSGGTGTGPATSGTTQNGTFRIRTAANGVIDFGSLSSTGAGWIQATDQTSLAQNYDLLLNPNGGNVVVGATAAINGAKLTVQSTGSAGIATGYGTTAGQWRRMYVETTNNNLYFYNGSNEGYLNTAGAWINASDARLKNSIVDIKHGLSAVMNTQPRSYKMNDLDGDYIGFVAQELQTVIPEVVSGNPERQLGVDYGSLVAVAFKAIQEQQALIQSLTTRITALETT